MVGKNRTGRLRKALVLAALCGAVGQAGAAKPANTAGRGSDKPFDLSAASLIASQACANLDGMIAELSRLPGRDGSESDQAYEARLKKWALPKRAGLPAFGQLTAFCAPADDVAGLEYDEDDQKLTLTLWDSQDELDGLRFLPLLTREEQKGSGARVNSAGERVRFRRVTTLKTGLLFARQSPFQIDRTRYSIDVPEADADKLLANLQLAIIGRVSTPFGLQQTESNEASVEDPIEETISSRAIYFSLEKVWFFDRKTGQVHLRVEPY